MTKFKPGSFYDEVENAPAGATPRIGEIKTVRDSRIVDETADHGGWILCNNRVLLQAEYPEGFLALGIYYNPGTSADDMTEFALPFDHLDAGDHYHNFIYLGTPV